MKYLRHVTGLVAITAMTACGIFDLSGPKLDENPNLQIEVRTASQYLPGILAAQALVQEGNLARTSGMWMQHFAGTDRQYASYDVYSVDEDAFSPEWGIIYTGGGLQDIRKLQIAASAVNDRLSLGIGKVLEALTIGTAASVWGDVPYSEALTTATPKLDKQLDVYAALQTLLDGAIADLQSGDGDGPGTADLIYGGNASSWTAAAHTLKARYYLNAGNYAQANAQAKLGISAPANDFIFKHSGVATEWNVWFQFTFWDRDSYMRAGAALVNSMTARNDPRRTGGCPAGDAWCAAYFSDDPGSAPGEYNQGAATLSDYRLFGLDLNDFGEFDQPIVTWAETQLIIAETAQRAGATAEASTALNAVRQRAGFTGVAVPTLPQIMEEKWIAMFQNIEAWSDYRRTCLPDLTPAAGKKIPARLVYPFAERNVNPNIPLPSAQPVRNQANTSVSCADLQG